MRRHTSLDDFSSQHYALCVNCPYTYIESVIKTCLLIFNTQWGEYFWWPYIGIGTTSLTCTSLILWCYHFSLNIFSFHLYSDFIICLSYIIHMLSWSVHRGKLILGWDTTFITFTNLSTCSHSFFAYSSVTIYILS